MCDVCGDLLDLLASHDARTGERGGMQINKNEILTLVVYVQMWSQRQCMCCYKDFKNFDRLNNLVQLVLCRAIGFIESLPHGSHHSSHGSNAVKSSPTGPRTPSHHDDEGEVDVTGVDSADINIDVDSVVTDSNAKTEPVVDVAADRSYQGFPVPVAELSEEVFSPPPQAGSSDNSEHWSLEEKDRLFQLTAKMFLINFPLYLAYKHCIHSSLDELSKQDASALNNYCELADPEVPIFLLQNVCYFCDSNGIAALAACFRDSDAETLPCYVAHSLIHICANIRMWMNYSTSTRYLKEIRSHIVHYICGFAEKDLRLAAARNMTELVWQALKEPRGSASAITLAAASGSSEIYSLDIDGLKLAFKYFTCSMLTLRLAGIAQINSQITTYNELAHTDGSPEVELMGTQLVKWLIKNNIVEQIFGPNLHVEIVKQSQIIFSFLAGECCISPQHIDIIWAAAQLKHCGKQVCELLLALVKNLDITPAQHLLSLMSQMDPSTHTEQTLFLASSLTRMLWSSAITVQNRLQASRFHGVHLPQPLPQYYTMISQGVADDDTELPGPRMKSGSFSSSGRSDSSAGGVIQGDASSGNETEEGEVKAQHLLVSHGGNGQRVLVKIRNPQPLSHPHRGASCSTDGHGSSEEDEEEEEEEEEEEDGDSNSSAFSGEGDTSPSHDVTATDRRVQRTANNLKMRIIHHGHGQRQPQLVPHPVIVNTAPTIGRKKNPDAALFVGNARVKSTKEIRYRDLIRGAAAHLHHGDEDDDEEDDMDDRSESDEAGPPISRAVIRRPPGRVRVPLEDEDDEGEDDMDEEDSSDSVTSPDSPHCVVASVKQGRAARKPLSKSPKRCIAGVIGHSHKGAMPQRKSQKADVVMPKSGDGASPAEHPQPDVAADEMGIKSSLQQQERINEITEELAMSQEILNGGVNDETNILQVLEGHSNSEADEHDIAANDITAADLFIDFNAVKEPKSLSPDDLESCLGEINMTATHCHGDLIEDILSPEEEDDRAGGRVGPGSCCNSSHFSDNNKSEKNMSDFEGEGVLSEEEELLSLNPKIMSAHELSGHACAVGVGMMPSTRRLGNMAAMYRKHHLHEPAVSSRAFYSQQRAAEAVKHSICAVKLNEICLPGNTLLWDLVQDHSIEKLPEGLAQDAEKALCTLVCFSTDRMVRTKFIEACIENLAKHQSVVISLRLLSKLFGSFNQFRAGPDAHKITMWAETELNLTRHFFNDLTYYTTAMRNGTLLPHCLFSYKEEIQTRLQFLTFIFSTNGSPESFKLTMEQVDTLWNCLATDPQCSDDCLNWFLTAAKSKDQHAMDINTFRHIFVDEMPQLRPEDTTMICLSLFNQLCSLARIANDSMDNPLSDEQVCGIDQLWGIALRAQNTDVSLTAIQCLNSHYINFGTGALEKEEEFVQKCMESLSAASSHLDLNPESSLQIVQRGLVLLTSHLESFRKRYAFHLRQWQLDAHSIGSHQKTLQDKHSIPIHIVLQPPTPGEKATIDMLSTDLVAELRAEITRWWESIYRPRRNQDALAAQQSQPSMSQQGLSSMTPILGAMLVDGPLRLITLGQELSVDVDEKTLAEMQFKDCQMVYVSQSASRILRRVDGSMPTSYLPPPPRARLPMTLLSRDPYFGCLFNLLQQLSNFCPKNTSTDQQEQCSLQIKARLLSRKVWDLVMLLPTNPEMFQALSTIVFENDKGDCIGREKWEQLLDAQNPHKLMYSLQIIESLSRAPKYRRRHSLESKCHLSGMMPSASSNAKTVSDAEETQPTPPEDVWSQKFIRCGGLKHLFGVFLSGRLQFTDGDHWNEWLQDCLAYLLKLMTQFSVLSSDAEITGPEDMFDVLDSPAKKMRKHKVAWEKVVIPRLNKVVLADNLSTDDIDHSVTMMMNILFEAAVPRRDYHQWPSTSWGHVEVVHYTMLYLVSLAHSYADIVQPALCNSPDLCQWLKRLTLESPEPPVRQESCQGLYRLCRGRTSDGQTGYNYLLPVLANLLPHVEEATVLKAPKKATHEEKEPFGPGCRDYFWLVCHLVDSISKEDAENSWEQDGSALDLNELAARLARLIVERGFLERRHNTVEDDGLLGLLSLETVVIKHNPPFKSSPGGQAFLLDVFNCLFALPSAKQRYLPKCKSQSTRSAAYDLLGELVKGNVDNYSLLHEKVMQQHHKDSHQPYSWDTWPHDEERAKCGYVGLTNLGATCYMATCMQHLYMMPEARKCVIEAECIPGSRHEGTLIELKKMFTYLLESERKAYNPRSFCKVYTMDHQPLNTGEQKDMTEFFTDLISKMEEMGPEPKTLVKQLFGGIITNNVVSLDCQHVSRTKEDFYTVRCQVTDMKNLYESLDEVTVKDMLEGDNMYTCSKCQRKVRAEKRACFKKLPVILCFNTMRYTFNMVTMMKEKVNTHFSFPLQLDMSPYMENNLIRKERLQAADDAERSEDDTSCDQTSSESYVYELIGVTVHTGTADGGHYYSFIRDRLNKNELGQDRWYLFNDAEVKPFDPTQIATECFGGEMMSKTYDSVTDKFMDFSFEKTNSAYMLFYERMKVGETSGSETTMQDLAPFSDICQSATVTSATATSGVIDTSTVISRIDMDEDDRHKLKIEISPELADWIWQDNRQFLQDKNIFEHSYFSFMWQMCSYIPTTLPRSDPEQRVSVMAAKLSASFILETLIHSKEKPTMLQWIEIATKLFNTDSRCCEWFMDTMADDDWWPQQILIRCPNQTVRQMFQRLVIHVINQLRPDRSRDADSMDVDSTDRNNRACILRFVRKMLAILEQDSRPQCKYLTEYFGLLLEFARMGDVECQFLHEVNAIAIMVAFFMGHKQQDNFTDVSDEDERDIDDVVILTDDKYSAQSLDKMITLIAILVEKSRTDRLLQLSPRDLQALVGNGKNFPFLYHQIRDSVNLRQTCNLIFSLCRWNERLAISIVQMLFNSIVRNANENQPFLKLLSMLVELPGGPPGMPPFMNYVLQKFWDLADVCPQQCLEWLNGQVSRNKLAHSWTLQNMEFWVETYLMNYGNVRVRNAAAYLLIALIPSNSFRQSFRTSRNILSPHKEHIALTDEALDVLHKIYSHLLSLLSHARQYVDAQQHGTTKLVAYFTLLNYCLVSRTEKLMFSPYFNDLWQLFQPKLSEPPISVHHNKQALLIFWHQVCQDCPENVKLIVSNALVTKNIAFNYILADHDDQDVMMVNRTMLPAYYGILRMCCQQSQAFTRQLAQHQNIQWAFKNISTHPTQYTAAVDELFRLMQLMVATYPETTEDELKQINTFRRNTIHLYLQILDARNHWQTLVSALKILVVSHEDRLLVIQHAGLPMLHEAFNMLHLMHHEATACHVTDDIVVLLTLISHLLGAARKTINDKKPADVKPYLTNWKEKSEFARKLLTLLNSFTPADVRAATFETLREMILLFQNECIQTIVPFLLQAHHSFQESNVPIATGPFFPKLGQKTQVHKTNVRSPRPQFQMFLSSSHLEATKGTDQAYDAALMSYYEPYHHLIDLLVRVAVNQQCLTESVINLSTAVAYEGVALHIQYFPKLWYEIYASENVDRRYIELLCASTSFIDYIEEVLQDERTSLNIHHIHQFFCNFFTRVQQQVLNDQGATLLDNICSSIVSNRQELENAASAKHLEKVWQRINGDLRAMHLILAVQQSHPQLSPNVIDCLRYFLHTGRQLQQQRRLQQQQAALLLQQQEAAAAAAAVDATNVSAAADGKEKSSCGAIDSTTELSKPDESECDAEVAGSISMETVTSVNDGNLATSADVTAHSPVSVPTDNTAADLPSTTAGPSVNDAKESVAAAKTRSDDSRGKQPMKRHHSPVRADDDDKDSYASPAKISVPAERDRSRIVSQSGGLHFGIDSSSSHVCQPSSSTTTSDVRQSSSSSSSTSSSSDDDIESMESLQTPTAASLLGAIKERPSTSDLVIRNVESLLKLLQKQ